MKIEAKIFPWNNTHIYDSGNWSLKPGEYVIVNTESGVEEAVVERVNLETEKEVPRIIRKATAIDIETIKRNNEKVEEAVKICRRLAKEKGLEMKTVNAHFSFDGGKVVFAFIAEKRVDFRELLKELSRKFQRSIRLQQIGSRDEARKKGGFGPCGRELCCIKFSGNLKSVTTEDARIQQMDQRGSDRISGLCGRLKCCLGFETEQYRENLKYMPEIGKEVEIEGKSAVITERDILSKKITVEFKDKSKKKVLVEELKQYK